MVTSDFICPSTTLHAVPGGLDLRGSIRVWTLRQRKIVKTIEIPGAGGHDRRAADSGRSPRARVHGRHARRQAVSRRHARRHARGPCSTSRPSRAGGWPQLMRMTADGTRLFITMNVAGRVAMFDTSDPDDPVLLSTLNLGADSGPHYLALTRDERRLVVSDYFLNEDDFGKVHQEGDHKVHVARVTRGPSRARPAIRSRLQHRVSDRSGAAARTGVQIERGGMRWRQTVSDTDARHHRLGGAARDRCRRASASKSTSTPRPTTRGTCRVPSAGTGRPHLCDTVSATSSRKQARSAARPCRASATTRRSSSTATTTTGSRPGRSGS